MNHWWRLRDTTEWWLLLQGAAGNVCKSGTVSYRVGSVYCLLLRKKSDVPALWLRSQDGRHKIRGCQSQVGCLSALIPILFFFFAKLRVMIDSVLRPPLRIPAPLCHPRLQEGVSSEPRQAVHISAQRVLQPETVFSSVRVPGWRKLQDQYLFFIQWLLIFTCGLRLTGSHCGQVCR